LADPGPVTTAMWVDAELESELYLDAVVTVVDCKYVLQHLHDKKPNGCVNEAQKQIALADVLMLNKTDLVSKTELEALHDEVRKINQVAKIIQTQHSLVDLNEVLNIHAYDMENPISIENIKAPEGCAGRVPFCESI